MASWLSIIGVSEAGPKALSDQAVDAIHAARLIVAAQRFHQSLGQMLGNTDCVIGFPSPLADLFARLDHHRDFQPDDPKRVGDSKGGANARGGPICVLATGDPLWFGIGATLIARYGTASCTLIPNISGLQMAAARMGWPLASTQILTVHGRDVERVLPSLQRRARLLVIAASGQSAGEVAKLLTDQGFGDAEIMALAHLGGEDESHFNGMAASWAHQVPDFHILAIQCPDRPARHAGAALHDVDVENDGKLTKADIRASAIAKLQPFPGAVMWDVGAGSGAVGIEFLRHAPRTDVYAIDKDLAQIKMAGRNARKFGVPHLTLVHEDLPKGVEGLPDPDAVFIGGGLSTDVIATCVSALRDGGVLVAHAVTLESEAILLAAWQAHGGRLVRFSVQHADPVGGFHGWRPLMPVTQWQFTKPSDGQG